MKSKFIYLAVAVLFLAGCNSKTKTTTTVASASSVEKSCCNTPCSSACSEVKSNEVESPQLVYFHNERRCATCMAVEDVAKETIASAFSTIAFHSYQIGDKDCEDLRQQLQISGQTLLLMGKDTTINLTNEAFMYARVEPDKYKAILEEAFKAVI